MGYIVKIQKRNHFRFGSNIFQNIIENLIGNNSYIKRIPSFIIENFGTNDYKLFWETMMKGDGNATMTRYTTKSKGLAQDFLELSVLLGLNASIRETKGTYRVNFNYKSKSYGSIRKENVKVIDYNDRYVYNLTVKDNHTVFAGIDKKFGWIRQSAYGVMGFPGFRLYDPDIAASVTAVGRFLNEHICKFVRNLGYEVIRGDTDSVLFKFEGKSKKEIIEICDKITEDLNVYLKGLVDEMGADGEYITIKFEKYCPTFFSAQDKDGKGIKKNYAGRITYKDGEEVDEIEVKGFASKRSNYSKFTRELQGEVLNMILYEKSEQEIIKYVSSEVNKLITKEYDWNYIAIPRGMTKSPAQYDKEDPWIRGCRYSLKHLEGYEFSPKPLLLYVSKIPGMPETKEICVNDNYEVPENIEIDWDKMIHTCVIMPLDRIFDTMNYSFNFINRIVNKKVKGQMTVDDYE